MKTQIRNLALTALAGFILAAPALATAKIEELLVRRQGKDMNIRVTLNNPDGRMQKGPIRVDLYARPDHSSRWEKIKTWNNVRVVGANKRISRDFFEANSAKLQAIAAAPAFEARAVLHAPGTSDVEMTGVYNGDK
jgi:hypothetical protein